MPQIILDTTLKDLYERDGSDAHHGRMAMVLCVASSEIDPSPKFRRNTKYLYQDSVFCSTPIAMSCEDHEKLQRTIAVKYLSLIPQRDAFVSGAMPVILFDPHGSTKAAGRGKEEAEKTMAGLTAEQRPEVLVFDSPQEMCIEANSVDCLHIKMALDGLEGFPLPIDLDTHYFLNSKAALSISGLPSPKSQLLELDGCNADAKDCCAVCRSHADDTPVPEGCTGERGPWLRDRIRETLARISRQPLPFVMKSQQTFGGGGTFMVSSRDDLKVLQGDLSTRILPKLFSQVTHSNSHLKPATLILSEMVTNLIGDWGLTFFVTRTGECVFLAATQQIVDSTKAWIGSKISYPAQDDLKRKFEPVMQGIGAWLNSYGYFGPCGADILEEATNDGSSLFQRIRNLLPSFGRFRGSDQTSARLKIVDLNVRTPGSLALGLLKGHFSGRNGLHEASFFSITVSMSRKSFAQEFGDRVESGRLVILSWFEDIDYGISYGSVAVGAPDDKTLVEEVAKIKDLASEIHW